MSTAILLVLHKQHHITSHHSITFCFKTKPWAFLIRTIIKPKRTAFHAVAGSHGTPALWSHELKMAIWREYWVDRMNTLHICTVVVEEILQRNESLTMSTMCHRLTGRLPCSLLTEVSYYLHARFTDPCSQISLQSIYYTLWLFLTQALITALWTLTQTDML